MKAPPPLSPLLLRLLVPVLTTILISSCSDSGTENPPTAARSGIFASNYPLAYFAETITGKPETIIFPKIDGDPAFWKPSAQDIRRLQSAELILFNGAGYEKWAPTLTLPKSRIVDTSATFQPDLLSIETATTHSHGPQGEHSHEGTAFTTWIDFSQASQQAAAVADALIENELVDPDIAKANLTMLTSTLNAIDSELAGLTAQNKSIPLVASHPIYDYLAHRYVLDIEPLVWEPDVAPDEEQWETLEKLLESHPAKWMIWENTPLPESVDRLKEMGVNSVVFNPSGNRPENGDFLSVMRSNVENMKPIFENR